MAERRQSAEVNSTNNRIEVETDLLKSRYSNVKLSTLKYYKVSEILTSPMHDQMYIDTNYASRTKTSFKSNFDFSSNP